MLDNVLVAGFEGLHQERMRFDMVAWPSVVLDAGIGYALPAGVDHGFGFAAAGADRSREPAGLVGCEGFGGADHEIAERVHEFLHVARLGAGSGEGPHRLVCPLDAHGDSVAHGVDAVMHAKAHSYKSRLGFLLAVADRELNFCRAVVITGFDADRRAQLRERERPDPVGFVHGGRIVGVRGEHERHVIFARIVENLHEEGFGARRLDNRDFKGGLADGTFHDVAERLRPRILGLLFRKLPLGDLCGVIDVVDLEDQLGSPEALYSHDLLGLSCDDGFDGDADGGQRGGEGVAGDGDVLADADPADVQGEHDLGDPVQPGGGVGDGHAGPGGDGDPPRGPGLGVRQALVVASFDAHELDPCGGRRRCLGQVGADVVQLGLERLAEDADQAFLDFGAAVGDGGYLGHASPGLT
nr:MAG TPA: hypothetical protein [Bacteriophage sp.]